jgi:NitT/TauT family transport system substrate-binding protein
MPVLAPDPFSSHRKHGFVMKTRPMIKVAAAAVALTLGMSLAACGGSGNSGSSSGTTSITVSYSEEVADELPLWIADSAGYFKQQGLDVKLVNLSSDQGFPALLSGQTQLGSMGGSQILSGAAAGADVKVLAALTPVYPYELWTKAAGAAELKGKKIGITSKSGSVYIATLAALKQLGLSPSDVNLVPLGSTTNVNNALLAGTIDAAVSHPPASSQFAAAGFKSLLNLAIQKQPNLNVGVSGLTSWIDGHQDTVAKFFTALREAVAREKSDEAFSVSLLKKHLGVSDEKALEETWTYYAQQVLPAKPTPTVDQLKSAQQALAGSVDGVDKLDLTKLVDTSFVDKAWSAPAPSVSATD